MTKMIFKGVATALLTPFYDDKVDFDALDRLLENQLEGGVNAVVVLGTTGEPATLSASEKDDILRFAVSRLKGRLPVIAGAGGNSTSDAVKAVKRAEELGADAALVVTPYYNKCTQQGLISHYTAIATQTNLPIICYNVPSRTGVNMLPETFYRLAKDKRVVAIKEASGNVPQIAECLRLATSDPDLKDVAVYSGDDALTTPIMSLGGAGVISVLSNILPAAAVEMASRALNGDFKGASEMQLELLPLINALFCEVNPIPVKRAAELLGLCGGDLRLPLTKMSDAASRRLEQELMAYFDKSTSKA